MKTHSDSLAKPLSRSLLERLDDQDPLRSRRDLFQLEDGLLYFDGNSLGPLPRGARQRLHQVIDQEWGRDLIRSWNLHGWIDLPRRVGSKIAHLIGASEDEVVIADSTSINLHKLLAAALDLRPDRRILLSLEGDFPTDRYLAWNLAREKQREFRLVPSEQLLNALNEDVAVLLLSHVHYKTGKVFDMARCTEAAREAGALVVWDLSHSAGALKVDLQEARADLAVGCGYKYFNGGPGAPAFLFVAKSLQDQARSPLPGWFSHADPFAFAREYQPAPGIDRFQCGTPPILSLAALDAALDVFEGIDLDELRSKSVRLGQIFQDLLKERLKGTFQLASPENSDKRGSHLSIRHPQGFEIMQALIDRGVIGDFRPPDVMRFGFTPLYQRHTDVWDAIEILHQILTEELWRDARYAQRGKVT